MIASLLSKYWTSSVTVCRQVEYFQWGPWVPDIASPNPSSKTSLINRILWVIMLNEFLELKQIILITIFKNSFKYPQAYGTGESSLN